jgi:membrane-associated protease RseP (regulator of RpoE activity)
MVASKFQVKDAFLDPYGVPTMHVAAEPARDKFRSLLDDFAKIGLVAILRGSGDTLTIKVVQKPQLKPPRKIINLALFLATVVTVFVAGWFAWAGGSLQQQFNQIVAPDANPLIEAMVFAVGLLSIIGLHEFGHKASAIHHRLDATLPYFIPGPPPIGTFGALISLRAPPANRDELFDLGLSGPAVGFVVTVVVALFSILLGTSLSTGQINQIQSSGIGLTNLDFSSIGSQPLLLILVSGLTGLLRPNAAGSLLLNSQLLFAAQIGALLTFLNIVPAWQLDGGHISRATFGPEGHRIATIIGLMVLVVTGYYSFALLLIIFMFFSRRGFAGVEPLDDVSPISTSRKLLYVVAIVMLLLTFSLSPLL